MSQEELPHATADELTACGLLVKTPVATTFVNFGIELVDQLFCVASLTDAHVVKKTLPSGETVFTTIVRARGLNSDECEPSKTRPECYLDKMLVSLKELWILRDGVTVVALKTKARKAVVDIRYHKMQFDECYVELKKRPSFLLPMDRTPRPPEGCRLTFTVSIPEEGKPCYQVHREDLKYDETVVRTYGDVKLYLPANAVCVKTRSGTHYFLDQAEWLAYSPTVNGKRRAPPPEQGDEQASKKARTEADAAGAATAVSAILERALATPVDDANPRTFESFMNSVWPKCDLPWHLPQHLDLMRNFINRRRGLQLAYRTSVELIIKAPTWAACLAAFDAFAEQDEALLDAWRDEKNVLALYSPTPVINTLVQHMGTEHMPAFERYLEHAAVGPACDACGRPRGPFYGCCSTCQQTGLCGFCRAATSDDPVFAVMEAGCSRAHRGHCEHAA